MMARPSVRALTEWRTLRDIMILGMTTFTLVHVVLSLAGPYGLIDRISCVR